MIPPSRQPGRPVWLLAPTTCILTSELELPPSLDRSWTSTTFAPFRAAASAAQTPGRAAAGDQDVALEVDERHVRLALEPPGGERRVDRGDRAEGVADLVGRPLGRRRLGLAVGEDEERVGGEARRRQEVAAGRPARWLVHAIRPRREGRSGVSPRGYHGPSPGERPPGPARRFSRAGPAPDRHGVCKPGGGPAFDRAHSREDRA